MIPNPSLHTSSGDFHDPAKSLEFSETQFFSPSLEGAETDHLHVPQITDELLPALMLRRLIVLGGHRPAEKVLFAKHLAWHLTKQLAADGSGSFHVRQWHPQSTLVYPSEALGRHEPNTIFLFLGLQPHQLAGYDLRRLLEDLRAKTQYAILTTDSELEQWGLDASWIEQKTWQNASSLRVSPECLANTLLEYLKDRRSSLPGELGAQIETLDPTSHLVGSLTVHEVALKLKTPNQIYSFVLELCSSAELSEVRVNEILEHLHDPQHSVHLWFRHLNPREQILTLGLVLLDGLLDDQAFACLELLVQHTWRKWDPTLAHFDYHELDRVAIYFQGTQEPGRATCIECLSPQYRQALFEAGWRLHRRRILATLPTLAEIVRDSPGDVLLPNTRPEVTKAASSSSGSAAADDGGTATSAPSPAWLEDQVRASRWYPHGQERDLFGSNLRTSLLHHCVAATLSQVGLMSPNAVEAVLLDLAQDERLGVQAVAATALARWREHNAEGEGDRKLFRLLSAWQSEAFRKEYAQRRRKRNEAAKPYTYVRATIALTVSRASIYDPPNKLSPTLLRLFERLAADHDKTVRLRFRYETLPWLVAGHLRQLNTFLWDNVAPQRDLLFGTALGMAYAHRLRPAEVRPILETWHRQAVNLSATAPDEETRCQRTHALIIVAVAYSRLIPSNGPGAVSRQEIFSLLGALLVEETAPYVRAAVLDGMIYQARTDLDQVAPFVQQLAAELSLDERRIVVPFLTNLYLEQRRDLEPTAIAEGASESDTGEVIEDVYYPLWLAGERPLTAIEKVLHTWLLDFHQPAAIQLALACLESFAATPLEQRERELHQKESQVAVKGNTAPEQELSTWQRQSLRRLPAMGYVAVFVTAPLDGDRRRVLQAALPELLEQIRVARLAQPGVLQQVWNGGTPRPELLTQPDNLTALLDRATGQKILLLERLREIPEPIGPELAHQLAWAYRAYAWRWPLGMLALALLALCSRLLGT